MILRITANDENYSGEGCRGLSPTGRTHPEGYCPSREGISREHPPPHHIEFQCYTK